MGIWAPTFGAYEIVAAFLLPFVVIRLVGGDRQSGALTLELQRPMSPPLRISAKALVLGAAGSSRPLPSVAALVLWKSYGGTPTRRKSRPGPRAISQCRPDDCPRIRRRVDDRAPVHGGDRHAGA